MHRVIVCIFVASLISGCNLGSRSGGKGVQETATTVGVENAQVKTVKAVAAQDAAQADEKKKLDARDSKVRASVDTASLANEDNPEGIPKYIVHDELALVQGLLEKAKAEDLAAAAERRAKYEQGRAEEARRMYATASADNTKLASDIAKAQQAAEAAKSERDKALEEAKKATGDLKTELERNRIENEKRLKELRDQFEAEKRSKIIAGLRWLGLASIAAGILFIALTRGTELIRGLLFLGGGIAANAAAVMIGHWLFPYIAWGAALLAAVGTAYWVYREHRNGQLAAKAKALSGDLVEAIEDIRTKLKNPSATTVDAIKAANTPESAIAAVTDRVKAEVDDTLKQYVTEADGTAAAVDAIRRERLLLR